MTQGDLILQALKSAGKYGVTNTQFYQMFMPRFPARILELRNLGHDIERVSLGRNKFKFIFHEPIIEQTEMEI